MTITRLWQAGGEIQHIGELPAEDTSRGTNSQTISSTKAKTGTYSFKTGVSSRPRGVAISTTQIRAGAFVNHNGLTAAAGSYKALIFLLTGTYEIMVRWKGDVGIELVVNGTVQATISAASAGFSSTNTWYHVGITAYANSSAGFVTFYVDGVQRLTFSGNTGSTISAIYIGGNDGTSGWDTSGVYFDDFYIDDAAGEANAAPPSPRFPFLIANADGNYTSMSLQGGGTHIACVDDSGAPNDDADYVYATASGVKDSYGLVNTTAGVTVPAGYSISAVIPVAWVRRTDSGVSSQIKLGTRLSSTDALGSAQTPTTSYGYVWERQTSDPGSGAWSEADVDSTEVVIESAGTF